MPRVSSPQSKVLDELNKQSQVYSEKATLLSNLLEQAEQFFREMPGKVAIQTYREHCDQELGFVKMGGEWRLVLIEFEEGKPKLVPVTQSTILQKALAATLLPDLYQQLIEKLCEGQSEIDRGLQQLKELPFLDVSGYEHLIEQEMKKGDSNDIPF